MSGWTQLAKIRELDFDEGNGGGERSDGILTINFFGSEYEIESSFETLWAGWDFDNLIVGIEVSALVPVGYEGAAFFLTSQSNRNRFRTEDGMLPHTPADLIDENTLFFRLA